MLIFVQLLFVGFFLLVTKLYSFKFWWLC